MKKKELGGVAVEIKVGDRVWITSEQCEGEVVEFIPGADDRYNREDFIRIRYYMDLPKGRKKRTSKIFSKNRVQLVSQALF